MTFKTTESNRFKPASYEPKPMPKQKLWLHDVAKSKTGGLASMEVPFILLISVCVILLIGHYTGLIVPA